MLTLTQPLIYVVEDDEDDNYLLRTIFEEHQGDYKVCFLQDGSELLTRLTHKLDGKLPDLILMDLQMPIFSGYDLIYLLKRDTTLKNIPITVLTASDHEDIVSRCYALGAESFISKIKGYQQLAHSIHTLLSQCLKLDYRME